MGSHNVDSPWENVSDLTLTLSKFPDAEPEVLGELNTFNCDLVFQYDQWLSFYDGWLSLPPVDLSTGNISQTLKAYRRYYSWNTKQRYILERRNAPARPHAELRAKHARRVQQSKPGLQSLDGEVLPGR